MGDRNGTLVLNVTKSGGTEVTRMFNNNMEEVYYADLLGGGSGSIYPLVSAKASL